MEENNENKLEEVIQNKPVEEKQEEVVENTVEQTDPEVTKVSIPSFGSLEPTVTKVDLSKPINQEEENEVKEDNTNDGGVVAESENAEPTQEQEEVQPEAETQEAVEEVVKNAEEAIEEAIKTGGDLPENIQKLVDFMDDTGGSVEEYVTLNKDYSKVDDNVILREYYRSTKPHLSIEEVDFLLEDQFSFDAEYGDEKENKRKKLALKEQVAEARNHLDGLKSKYYEDIKSGSKLSKEQKEAVDFFDKFNEESKQGKELAKRQQEVFQEKTDNVFNQSFEGFEYNVGDKVYRYKVKDAKDVKQTQSDISNFIGKFLDKDNNLEDAAGYHKSLYTAMNADSIAKHFYEQGKSDAIKDSIKSSKNIDMAPRQTHEDAKTIGGMKFKALNLHESSKLRIKQN
jgi:hypothetical protein